MKMNELFRWMAGISVCACLPLLVMHAQDAPPPPEAEKHLYGLYSKQRYVQAFGTWNNAIREAGLSHVAARQHFHRLAKGWPDQQLIQPG